MVAYPKTWFWWPECGTLLWLNGWNIIADTEMTILRLIKCRCFTGAPVVQHGVEHPSFGLGIFPATFQDEASMVKSQRETWDWAQIENISWYSLLTSLVSVDCITGVLSHEGSPVVTMAVSILSHGHPWLGWLGSTPILAHLIIAFHIKSTSCNAGMGYATNNIWHG